MQQLDNSNVSKHLGKSSEYISQYDPSLLVREPRASNRVHLGISDDEPPFDGFDTWDGYEVSALTDNGAPVTAVAKVMYSCKNKYIVESKSMKLYWNSFNMTKMGKNRDEVLENIRRAAESDLGALLETNAFITLTVDQEYENPPESDYFNRFEDAFMQGNIDYLADTSLQVTEYSENPDILQSGEKPGTYWYHSTLLKSNCRVTGAPDFGDIFIVIDGQVQPTKESLFKYIVSFRDECHFHEEIIECCFKRLLDKFNPRSLIVCGKYVRRGGWGITPLRYKIDPDGDYASYLSGRIKEFKQMPYLSKTSRQ